MKITATAPVRLPDQAHVDQWWASFTRRFTLTTGPQDTLTLQDRSAGVEQELPGLGLTGRQLGQIGSTYAFTHPQFTWASLTGAIGNDDRRPIEVEYAEHDRPGRAHLTVTALAGPEHATTDGNLAHLRWQGRVHMSDPTLLSGTVDLDWLHLAATGTVEQDELVVNATVRPKGPWIVLSPLLLPLRGEIEKQLGELTRAVADRLTRLATTDPATLVAELSLDDELPTEPTDDTPLEYKGAMPLEEIADTRWLRSPWSVWNFSRRAAAMEQAKGS
ncbi:hypothetical protein ACQCX2_12405 [Propionibacteriaceae bacterium Y1700]|uniref:hypothetical protein n=1 Tax=Microlunatus sp. Y1700 TaxID=3418487 RepID=UPI003DA7A651